MFGESFPKECLTRNELDPLLKDEIGYLADETVGWPCGSFVVG
jgi:hypothetical protein